MIFARVSHKNQEINNKLKVLPIKSFCILLLIVSLCWIGPFFSPYEFDFIDWENMATPPNFQNHHYFGTDSMGRDLFVRTLEGGQISILVGIFASFVSLIIGVLYGSVSGYIGGKTDEIMMRVVDVLYALPFMFIVLLIMIIFGSEMYLVFIAIGGYIWLDMARIVRGQTLHLKKKEFVIASLSQGAHSFYILVRHIFPNLISVVIVYLTILIPQVILIEAFLSFLGLGIQEPATSWGALVQEGSQDMEMSPWSLIFPASFLTVTLFCFHYIGDGIRDVFDPKQK